MRKLWSATNLQELREKLSAEKDAQRTLVTVCGGTGCRAYACDKVYAAFEREISRQKIGNKVGLKLTGCHGFCERGPLVVIHPEKIMYQQVAPEDVPGILADTVLNHKIIERLLYTDPVSGKKIVHEHEVPFYAKQQRLVFGSNGLIDPTSIDDYIAIDGYSALSKALFEMRPEEVIEEVKKSGLRGRGGGGFPTGKKWDFTRHASSANGMRYVICNADEGDPGAYMDRSVLEGNPHCVIEGIAIGAYAIGSKEGYVYVRREYPLAVENLTVALEQAREYGLLGTDILGSGFDFNVRIARGGGAFICGEETALISSIEAKPGEPHPRPPYPAQKGLWGKPTNLNNVETWANVPVIISKGANWYSRIGTEGSKGTKIFSLVGKNNNTGLVEVPMGMTLREIIFDIGGGIRDGKKFKAVQTGGPSGGCIPESMLDLQVDFDKLSDAGSMMGSGGMIVMDETTCMVDLAKYFTKFLTEESCGKCVPCREGLDRMLDILTDITEGRGKEEDIELLEELGEVIRDASLCALGGTAPNPVLSTIRYFRDEYEAHIKDKRCPAGVCKALITFSIDEEKCTGCGKCAKTCPQGAISGKKKEPHAVDTDKCIKCGLCRESCKFEAILVS